MRRVILFNENYVFEKEGKKENVTLPHTWNAVDGQSASDYYRGECTYTKSFAKPELHAGEELYLEINGANSSSEVSLNGKVLAAHDGGYSTYRVNLTNELLDTNELQIKVDNSPNDHVYPQKADFTFYGGLYRDVKLITVAGSHFDLDYYGGKGFYVTPEMKEDGSAEVRFDAYVCGEADEVRVSVCGESDRQSLELAIPTDEVQPLYDDGELARVRHFTGVITLDNPHLWQGLKDPFLYTATAELKKDGQAIDEVTAKFGCRSYSLSLIHI